MGQTVGFAAGSGIVRQAASIHPETPDEHQVVLNGKRI